MKNAKAKTAPPAPPLITAAIPPPDWFGRLAVVAVFLLPAAKPDVEPVHFLSLGELLLLPLAVLSAAMGFLQLRRSGEKPFLPLWLSAVLPAILWLAATGTAFIHNGAGAGGADALLPWAARLVAPTLALLPLLVIPEWRDRLLWALAGGVAMNAVAVFWQARLAGLVPPDRAMLDCGGLLPSQQEYGVMLAVSLPLIAAWRGGERDSKNKALATMFCTFLLPALALSACFGWAGLCASALGLTVAWAAWRRYAWILGVFLLLLVFGYGTESREGQYLPMRQLLAESALPDADSYRGAFRAFEAEPFLGTGTGGASAPWYAFLLGGTGLAGLGMWLVFLGDIAARSGRRLLGSVFALCVLGIWTDILAEGAGSLVGFLLAFSCLDEQEHAPDGDAHANAG